MAAKVSAKTTFDVASSIEPIYTGGEVSSDASGSLLATSVDDDALVVDIRSGRPLVRIDGDGESVTSLALSPNGSHLVVCSRSLSMRIYVLSHSGSNLSAKLIRTLKPHTTPVLCSTIDSTSSILVTGGADGTAKVWDVQGGYCSHTFHGHGGLVTALEVFEATHNVTLRKSTISRKRKISNGHDQPDAIKDRGTTMLLATGGEDGRIKVWDLATRDNIATLESHVSVIRSIKFSVAHGLLLSASRDKTIVIWDTQTWSLRRIIPCLETLESGGFVANTIYCYSGGDNGRLRIWNSQTGSETTTEQQAGLENEAIVAIIELPSEETLLSIHQDQTIAVHSFKGLENLASGKSIPPLPILRRISGNHDEIIDMACIGPGRSWLALATNTESIKIISIADMSSATSSTSFGSDVAILEGHQDIIICLDVDWSGHWLATGAKDNTARLWRLDPESGRYECFAVFQGHAESIGALSLPKALPQSSAAMKAPLDHPPAYLLTGSHDKTVKRWDTSKLSLLKDGSEPHTVAKAVYTRVAHEKDINALDTSPVSSLFASASQDKTIKIWSVEDGSTVGILRGHKRGVWSVKFSPAGTPAIDLTEGGSSGNRGLLLSGSGDRSVKIWSLTTYTCLQTFEGHSNSVLKVLWLPPPELDHNVEGHQRTKTSQQQPMIASASSDTLVKIWTPYASPDSDHLLATLDNHTDRVWSLATPYISKVSHDALSEEVRKSKSSKSEAKIKSSAMFTFISGAADATLTFWKDTTTVTAAAASRQVTERIEQDQLLQNHIHARNYRESITLALTLNHPGRLLKILEDVINKPEIEKEDKASITGSKAVDEVLSHLSLTELYRLLERVRDWNTNARTAPVAQRVLNVLLRSYPADTWSNMARNQRRIADALRGDGDPEDNSENAANSTAVVKSTATKTGKLMGIKELFRALEVYTERHYKRMEELVDESYLIEYTLREMDEVTGGGAVGGASGVVDGNYDGHGMNGAASILTNGEHMNGAEQDMIML